MARLFLAIVLTLDLPVVPSTAEGIKLAFLKFRSSKTLGWNGL